MSLLKTRLQRIEKRDGTAGLGRFDLWMGTLTDDELSAVIAAARSALTARSDYDPSQPPSDRPLSDEEAAEFIELGNAYLAELRTAPAGAAA